ncbi:hypothetical protein TgHK011_002631 [Trichoderma gracile]|nr:hypothetical protein TgHK011_002631 [Trichoderma gracile]
MQPLPATAPQQPGGPISSTAPLLGSTAVLQNGALLRHTCDKSPVRDARRPLSASPPSGHPYRLPRRPVVSASLAPPVPSAARPQRALNRPGQKRLVTLVRPLDNKNVDIPPSSSLPSTQDANPQSSTQIASRML